MMMKAEMAMETSRSRAQTATTGRGRVIVWVGAAPGTDGCGLSTSDIVFLSYRNRRCRGEKVERFRVVAGPVQPGSARRRGASGFGIFRRLQPAPDALWFNLYRACRFGRDCCFTAPFAPGKGTL